MPLYISTLNMELRFMAVNGNKVHINQNKLMQLLLRLIHKTQTNELDSDMNISNVSDMYKNNFC